MMRPFTASLLLLLSLSATSVAAKAILGVDLGSLYMKVALVQRGAPLEIVTNLHSKRKTENMVLFDSGTRFYGADANSLYGRKSQKTPSSVSVFLGRNADHPSVSALKERHLPIMPEYNETRSGVYLKVGGEEYTPEELTSMVLGHAKDITVAYGTSQGNTLVPQDIVMTVPSFSTQHERKALMDAAELAGLNILGLLEENTAAALHYGMDKIMEEPKILIFYNLGASALQVSVVRFLSYKHKDSKYSKEKTVGGLEILGKAWDSTLGGMAIDNRIVEYFADEFNAKWGKGDVRTVPRAMAKLRIQANKVKHVLSANKEMPVYMDSLHDDVSLQTSLSREKMEELCADLMSRATAPIEQAMKAANVTLDQVDGIELIGGGMRVPRIQQEIKTYLEDKMPLGMHINSDESMALGAAFHGANISTAFKVRHVGLSDMTPFGVTIGLSDMEPVEGADDEEPWSKQATMFKAGSKTGVKKTIAFTHSADVHCAIDYQDTDVLPEGTSNSIVKYNITGIKEFAKEMEDKGLGAPKVSLQFELSISGVTQLVKAEAAVEEIVTVQEEIEVEEEDDDDEEEGEGEAKDDDRKEDEEKKEEPTEEKKEEPADETKADEDKKEEKKDDKKKKKKKKLVDKEKKKMHRKSLSVGSYHSGPIQPYSPVTKAESTEKLAELDRKDKERILLEEARNKVESYIYHIKNKLLDDEENIGKVSTEDQRETIRKAAEDAEEWMYDDGYGADLATMEDKYAELSEPAEKIFSRVTEMTARPEAIKTLEERLAKIEKLMGTWEETMKHITEEERKEVLDKIDEVKAWIKEKTDAQEKADPTEDPVFTSAEVPLQTKPLEKIINKLSRKPKPKPEKKNETKADSNTTKADDNNTTESSEGSGDEAKEEDGEADKEEEGEKVGEEL